MPASIRPIAASISSTAWLAVAESMRSRSRSTLIGVALARLLVELGVALLPLGDERVGLGLEVVGLAHVAVAAPRAAAP